MSWQAQPGSPCAWSPTGDHFYQLVEQQSGDRRTITDRCRYCGAFAWAPVDDGGARRDLR